MVLSTHRPHRSSTILLHYLTAVTIEPVYLFTLTMKDHALLTIKKVTNNIFFQQRVHEYSSKTKIQSIKSKEDKLFPNVNIVRLENDYVNIQCSFQLFLGVFTTIKSSINAYLSELERKYCISEQTEDTLLIKNCKDETLLHVFTSFLHHVN